MYIMCVCLFSALSRRVGALQISIIIIIKRSFSLASLLHSLQRDSEILKRSFSTASLLYSLQQDSDILKRSFSSPSFLHSL